MDEMLSTLDAMSENLPFTEDELIVGLRNNWEDQRVQEKFQLWLVVMEAARDSHPDPDQGALMLEIKRASLYSRAHLNDFAAEAWAEVQKQMQAHGFNV